MVENNRKDQSVNWTLLTSNIYLEFSPGNGEYYRNVCRNMDSINMISDQIYNRIIAFKNGIILHIPPKKTIKVDNNRNCKNNRNCRNNRRLLRRVIRVETENHRKELERRKTRIIKNSLLDKLYNDGYTDEDLKAEKWVDNKYFLLRGVSQSVHGPIVYLIQGYIYLNLVLAGFQPAFYRFFGDIQDFYPCDNYLPKFLCDIFYETVSPLLNVIINTNQKSSVERYCLYRRNYHINIDKSKITLTQEEMQKIQDLSRLLFKSIYSSDITELDSEWIKYSIERMFYFKPYWSKYPYQFGTN